jgi:hypothetical protein
VRAYIRTLEKILGGDMGPKMKIKAFKFERGMTI